MRRARRSIAAFCKLRYGLEPDPETEVLVLIGSKEGLAHFPLAVLNPGEISLVPDPCYPVYRSSSMFAGADVYTMPLDHTRFPSDLDAIPADVFGLARLMFLNYPNNPTGATADLSFFQKSSTLRGPTVLSIAQDAAYNEMYYEKAPPSILQVPGAKDVSIEFHSLSKTFNMTGWRHGIRDWRGTADCGARPGEVEYGFGSLHGHPVCRPTALDEYRNIGPPIRALYKERRDAFLGALQGLGWEVPTPQATFYVWIPCLAGTDQPSSALGCSTRPTL